MLHEDKTRQIIAACLEVYNNLGNGFLEAVYTEVLAKEFEFRGIVFEREKQFNIVYKDIILEKAYRVDFFCFDCIILEIKALETILPVHLSQLINYLKVSGVNVGLIINFGAASLEYKRRDNYYNHKILKSLNP